MTTTPCIEVNRSLSRAVSPVDVLQSVLAALNQANISRAVDQFADDFAFNDYALDLEFRDKKRLTEFFQKTCELFPDTVVELISTFECGDYAIAEWKLSFSTWTDHRRDVSLRTPPQLPGRNDDLWQLRPNGLALAAVRCASLGLGRIIRCKH